MGKYLAFVKGFFSSRFFVICFLLCACLLLFSVNASAQMTNAAVFSDILQRYQSVASAWSTTITKHATWLFWCLVSISMIWTFGMMALEKVRPWRICRRVCALHDLHRFLLVVAQQWAFLCRLNHPITSTNCQRGNGTRDSR